MEYDFKVEPGADAGQISMQVSGAESIRLSDAGALVMATPNGTLSFKRPEAYQDIAGKRRKVKARFCIQGSNVRFLVERYDHTHE